MMAAKRHYLTPNQTLNPNFLCCLANTDISYRKCKSSCFCAVGVKERQGLCCYFFLVGVGDFMPRGGAEDLAFWGGAGDLAAAGAGVADLAVGITMGTVGGMILLGEGVGLMSGTLSPCLYTLTTMSTDSPPYLFWTVMVYLPESSRDTPLIVRLANLPESMAMTY